MAVVCPRVPAVLSRPSSPGEATILFQKEGAVAVVCPRVPAVLSRPSSPGEATILSQKDLDWLQSGVVFPPPPALQNRRRSVPWRQVKRRERRAALKFGYSTSATLKCPTSTLPCKYSGVSGQLPHGRFKRLDRSAASGPATPPPEAVRRPTLAPTAWAPFGGCTNLIIEKRFMRRFAARTPREVSGCPVRRRKELPVLNLWRRSRKAINRELHALNGNTSTPVSQLPSSAAALSQSDTDSMEPPATGFQRELDVVERQLRVLAERRARVEAELLHITCEETFLRRQQRRLLNGIFGAKYGEAAGAVDDSPLLDVGTLPALEGPLRSFT